MREQEEIRLAEEEERNAVGLAEREERERQRKEFNKALHFETAQLGFGQELTKAFTYSYMQLMIHIVTLWSRTDQGFHVLVRATDDSHCDSSVKN